MVIFLLTLPSKYTSCLLLVPYHSQKHLTFMQIMWWVLGDMKLDLQYYGQIGNDTIIKPIHETGVGFCGSNQVMGQFTSNKFILVSMDHKTKRVEARALWTNTVVITIKFLYECILTIFECTLTLVMDQGVHFVNDVISYLVNHFLFHHTMSTRYCPQNNWQVKSIIEVLARCWPNWLMKN